MGSTVCPHSAHETTALDGLESASLSPALREQLLHLTQNDQDLLARMIERFRLSAAPGQEMDVVAFIHQYLKADLELSDMSVFEELATLKAPSMVKEFAQAERFPLPTDYLPLSESLDAVIGKRSSERNYGPESLELRTVSSFLHHTYGVKRIIAAYNVKEFPVRMTPSSGGLQPIDLYMVVNQVEGLPKGLYYYEATTHSLLLCDRGNMRRHVSRCSLGSEFVAEAPIVFLLAANMPRIRWKYGERSYRCVHLDAGHLSQSMYLVATALELNVCAVFGYLDDMVNRLMHLDGHNEFIVLLLAMGQKPSRSSCPA